VCFAHTNDLSRYVRFIAGTLSANLEGLKHVAFASMTSLGSSLTLSGTSTVDLTALTAIKGDLTFTENGGFTAGKWNCLLKCNGV
jgi:hypothetical protein